MMKTIAIFGAGPGLGASVATRFGREGYQIALVARRRDPLDAMVAELAKDAITAVAFPADLSQLETLPGLVRTIEEKLGRIDVAIYATVPPGLGFVNAVDLDAETLRPILQLFTLAPIQLAHELLDGMIARGDGAIVYVGGLSGVQASPGYSGPGPAMAAARNFFFSLHAEAKSKGIYSGTTFIGGMVEHSAGHQAAVASGKPITFPVVSPDLIAEELWLLVNKRDYVEIILPRGASLPAL